MANRTCCDLTTVTVDIRPWMHLDWEGCHPDDFFAWLDQEQRDGHVDQMHAAALLGHVTRKYGRRQCVPCRDMSLMLHDGSAAASAWDEQHQHPRV